MAYFNKKIKEIGFTLVEVLIAAAIFTTMMVIIYNFIISTWRHFTRGVTITGLNQDVRIVLEKLKRDLRAACTRGSLTDDAPIGTKFYKIIVEDPDPGYGKPATPFGPKYSHGYTLKFFKFWQPATQKENPKASLITYRFVSNFDYGGKKVKAVLRTEEFPGGGGQNEIIATFRQDSATSLYFVKFTVNEVTPEMIQAGDAKPEELSTGGRDFVRIRFVAETAIKGKIITINMITVVGPRQINSFLRETSWKPNSSSLIEVPKDLLPDKS